MHIVMVGTGYVGLVSGTCFAEYGWKVTCIDNDENKIDLLDKGIVPIFEPGLSEMVLRHKKNGRLSFSTDLSEAAHHADVIFLAIGTPMQKGSSNADLTMMITAVKQVAEALTKNTIIVVKSTVPVGSCHKIAAIIAEARPELKCPVVSNPEFLREGAAIEDFMNPERIVIGTDSPEAEVIMKRLYNKYFGNKDKLLFTTIESSELIKYAANGFLATKIAFINEMADICEAVGADINDVSKGMGMDSRIGNKFLNAGPGFGGSCFPKDTNALAMIARDAGTVTQLTEAVIASNDARKEHMARKIIQACGGSVKGKKIAILGVTFKAATDDMRDSPSLVIIPELLKDGAELAIYDPAGMKNAAAMLTGNIRWWQSVDEVTKGADCTVILTEWPQFGKINLLKLAKAMRSLVLVDLRNMLDRKTAEEAGFTYVCIGQRDATQKCDSKVVSVMKYKS